MPVTVRFSNAPGVPDNLDNDPGSGPRGMAIRFTLPGGAFTDIMAISHNGFVVGTGEDFLAFLKAIAASGPDAPHPTPIETFLASHPRAAKFATEVRTVPQSYATVAYFSNNAVVFVDENGKKQPVRYQIVPVAGEATLDSASAAKAGGNYLATSSGNDWRAGRRNSASTRSSRTPAIPPTTARSSGPTTGSGCCSARSA